MANQNYRTLMKTQQPMVVAKRLVTQMNRWVNLKT